MTKHQIVELTLVILITLSSAPADAQSGPTPVRHDVAKAGSEILVLRNHRLHAGGHEQFYQASRDDVWPYFERMGARVVGQWKVIHGGAAAPHGQEDVYRLVRYASIEHWESTRFQRTTVGDGPAFERDQKGRKERATIEVGSRGAFFLRGETAPGGPYFLPPLREKYDLVQAGSRPSPQDTYIPVRVDVAQPGVELVAVRHDRIRKGTFERFVALTKASIWPWEEKLGARPLGQWQVVFPNLPGVKEASRGTSLMSAESNDYDEVVTMTRYASKAHYDALAPEVAVHAGGNGPDWKAYKGALQNQQALTLSTGVELAQGPLYHSPPAHLPGLPERYRKVD